MCVMGSYVYIQLLNSILCVCVCVLLFNALKCLCLFKMSNHSASFVLFSGMDLKRVLNFSRDGLQKVWNVIPQNRLIPWFKGHNKASCCSCWVPSQQDWFLVQTPTGVCTPASSYSLKTCMSAHLSSDCVFVALVEEILHLNWTNLVNNDFHGQYIQIYTIL